MKYYMIAGERSGDLHGSNLVRALKQRDTQAYIRAWGGDLMKDAGAELVVHYKNLAFMGVWEVITNLITIKRYLDQCKKDLQQFGPDVLVLIDYPGFNLKMAEFAHKLGIRVCYYISPKLWAWNQQRASKIKRYVDRMYSILPFEEAFYQNYHYQVEYVGNPLVETILGYETAKDFRAGHQIDQRPIVAILPGSRKQEIRQMLRQMLALIEKFPAYNFVVAAVDNIPRDYYRLALERADVTVVFNQTYPLLSESRAALVASGTASLETALFEVPQVVCYKTSWLTYIVIRLVIKVKYISLVNLIAGRSVVPELIQSDFTGTNLTWHLEQLVDPEHPKPREQLAGYAEVRSKIGQKKASQETARLICEFLGVSR